MKKSIAMLVTVLIAGVSFNVWGQDLSNEEKLAAHSSEFARDVIKVTDGVYVAIGFALANSIMIEGDDGIIIVDTTENAKAAQEVLAEFRKITAKPVKAIIYTHFHADHITGASIFAGDDQPDIYSHATTERMAEQSYSLLLPIITARSIRQFGVMLPADQCLNNGIGPKLRLGGQASLGYIPANKPVGEVPMEVTVAGVQLKLVHAPGETSDQLYVWLPEKKVLLPGDNFYHSFPNLYAIRGTKYRDVRKWADSLDLMLAEGAEYLVPSHTRPITGAQEIQTRLTNYRDAIRFVHDETIKGINKGLTPDQLVQTVKLPEHLADDPWLVEYYGTVEWSVRNIFNGYLGWFDGNPARLSPLAPADRAAKVAKLVGGPKKLLKAAQAALSDEDYQWALELTDFLRELDPDSAEMKAIRKEATIALGKQQISANGRNYYLSSAGQGR